MGEWKPEASRHRILVVDDEAAIGSIVRRTLRPHDVVAVTSATEATVLLEAGESFDLILCDLLMPEVTGIELHATIVERWPAQATRVVFLTGDETQSTTAAFLERVPNRYLAKPSELAELRALCEEVLGTPADADPPWVASDRSSTPLA